jgi:DNA ligase-1
MNSNEIYEALEVIASNPSKLYKIDLLTEFLEDEEFKRVIVLAYNPFITFGVKSKTINISYPGDKVFNDQIYNVFDKLSTRVLTGNAAREEIFYQMSLMSTESQILFNRILDKNLEAGFDVKSINKACKGLIPTFAYMRCSLPKDSDPSKWDWDVPHYSQEKADGLFINITYLSKGAIVLNTRKGQEFPIWDFWQLTSEIKAHLISNHQYHGELLVTRNGEILSRKEGNGVLNSVMKGGLFGEGEKPFVKLWDSIPMDVLSGQKRSNIYTTRYNNLVILLEGASDIIKVIETKQVKSLDEAQDHYTKMRSEGKEGTILKRNIGLWKDGTSKDQVKFKDEKVADLRVLAMNEGSGKNKETFGSLLCASEDGLLMVSVSGFTDEKRLEIYDAWGTWEGSIIHVKYNELIHDVNGEYSLFLPRFDGIAFDKEVADDLERILKENK